jgi:hypothetical protein
MGVFKDPEHEEFFVRMKEITGQDDVYHRSLFYTIGACRETRDHYLRIYDMKNREIRPECLKEGWQTHGSRKVCLMAFNLWNGYVSEEDPRESSPEDLFASEYASYFLISLRIRYPEYTR